MYHFCICLDTCSTVSMIDAIDRCNHCRPYMEAARDELRQKKRAENRRAQDIQRQAVRHS